MIQGAVVAGMRNSPGRGKRRRREWPRRTEKATPSRMSRTIELNQGLDGVSWLCSKTTGGEEGGD